MQVLASEFAHAHGQDTNPNTNLDQLMHAELAFAHALNTSTWGTCKKHLTLIVLRRVLGDSVVCDSMREFVGDVFLRTELVGDTKLLNNDDACVCLNVPPPEVNVTHKSMSKRAQCVRAYTFVYKIVVSDMQLEHSRAKQSLRKKLVLRLVFRRMTG
jgi:hypothetical protein